MLDSCSPTHGNKAATADDDDIDNDGDDNRRSNNSTSCGASCSNTSSTSGSGNSSSGCHGSRESEYLTRVRHLCNKLPRYRNILRHIKIAGLLTPSWALNINDVEHDTIFIPELGRDNRFEMEIYQPNVAQARNAFVYV